MRGEQKNLVSERTRADHNHDLVDQGKEPVFYSSGHGKPLKGLDGAMQ